MPLVGTGLSTDLADSQFLKDATGANADVNGLFQKALQGLSTSASPQNTLKQLQTQLNTTFGTANVTAAPGNDPTSNVEFLVVVNTAQLVNKPQQVLGEQFPFVSGLALLTDTELNVGTNAKGVAIRNGTKASQFSIYAS